MPKLRCPQCGSNMKFTAGSKAHQVEIKCRCGGTYQPVRPAERPAPIDRTIRPWAGEKGKGDEPFTDS